MLGHRAGKAGTRLGKQLGPGLWVKLAALTFKAGGKLHKVAVFIFRPGDKVMVGPVIRVTVSFYMVLILGPVVLIHIARVPLAVKSRGSINAPVKVNAELGIFKPLRRRVYLR